MPSRHFAFPKFRFHCNKRGSGGTVPKSRLFLGERSNLLHRRSIVCSLLKRERGQLAVFSQSSSDDRSLCFVRQWRELGLRPRGVAMLRRIRESTACAGSPRDFVPQKR